eukprot:TRINITY_DN4022_c0_g1_i1.p1 TRINITY_DN4022_c0_g1~~TRINITY_DN4022_c0_g1_i1.p1  ORF type:complete len:373 (+),score=116.82 TRINITY_DN4022_c0_g1_i1:62-1120(+)
MSDVETFAKVFDDIAKEIIADFKANEDLPPEALEWIDRMMRYTVPGGKMNRGRTVLATLQAIKGKDNISEAEAKRANILGWCVEWLQAFFLVADDIMDGSVTRRGQPCWYKNEDVGLIAINDSLFLEGLLYTILKKHFRSDEYYVDLVELFLSITLKTELGQLLDLSCEWGNHEIKTNPEKEGDFTRFTMERYRRIVLYKTAYYSFYLPIALGMIMGGIKDDAVFKQAKDICLEMGEYFQIQDDYLDCYGTPEQIGKVGTDIQDFKCGWLAIKCLEKASPEQRAIMAKHYGRDTPEQIQKIKDLYVELDLAAEFTKLEKDSYESLKKKIAGVQGMPAEAFESLLAKIYKREK